MIQKWRSVLTGAKEAADVHWGDDMEALRKLAPESLRDPRIANYFSRGHVKAGDVLRFIDDNDVYAECRETDAFQDYTAKRDKVDELNSQLSAAVSADSINWKTIFIALVAVWSVLLIMSELGDKVYPGFKAPLAIFSAVTAVTSGLLVGLCARAREFPVTLVTAAFFTLALSACSIALPVAFAIFPWQPVGLYVEIATAFTVGVLLSEEKTTHDSRDLARALMLAIVCTVDWRERRKCKKKWLDHSLTAMIYPNAVLAINHVLGEDSTKLLVEQDSEGLRRLQDPKLTVSTKSEHRLRNLLDRMDGGSIAVTGPRGAGKSTLLRRMCGPQGYSAEGPPSIYISAPAEYVAREFLAELFQQVCDSYLEQFDSPVAGMRYRGLRTHRDTVRVVRQVVTILRLAFRAIFALALLAVAFGPLLKGVHLPTAVAHLPVKHWRNELTQDAKAAWDKYQVAIRVVAGILVLFSWPKKQLRRLGTLRRPELVRRARNYSIHLKIERTSSWGANLGLPTILGLPTMRGSGLSLSKGISEKYTPWSLPELVGKLRDFIEDISQPTDTSVGTMVIGIDEIDRIGSVEQAERFIGEIKTIFGIRNCFFLVSVAEDVGFLFSRRSIVGQSTLEHSFDDVVVVDTLELDEARELLSTRVPGFTDSFVFLALALSGGLPREMIRVARRLVEVNHQETEDQLSPKIGDLALRLIAEDVAEVLRTSRNQLARMSLPDPWGDVFYQLRAAMALLRSGKASPGEHQKIIGGLCSLRPPNAADLSTSQETDETAAAKIIAGLSAFACYSITVVEAFNNDYFDLHAARETTHDTAGGSYVELAAARLELGISPESSQSIIRRFRAQSGLPPLS
jgi:hypothetical protein